VGKLSGLVAGALALLLVGCAGEVEGPEEFPLVTEHSGVYLRALDAAELVNAEDPTILVTIELLTPGEPEDEGKLVNLDAAPSGPGYDPERVVIGATAKTHLLLIGDDASTEQIAVGMRDWVAMFTKRD
jgi:hypothetical protein